MVFGFGWLGQGARQGLDGGNIGRIILAENKNNSGYRTAILPLIYETHVKKSKIMIVGLILKIEMFLFSAKNILPIPPS